MITSPLLGLLLWNFGPMELLLILVIILVVFGATKLPALGKGLGEGIRNFKRGVHEGEDGGIDKPSDKS